MFGEFNRKPVKGTFVQTHYETLNDLSGKEFQRTELLQPVMIYGIGQKLEL